MPTNLLLSKSCVIIQHLKQSTNNQQRQKMMRKKKFALTLKYFVYSSTVRINGNLSYRTLKIDGGRERREKKEK